MSGRPRRRATSPAIRIPVGEGVRAARTVERHREILAEALDLMAESGYHGASLRDLAKRLGISQPSLYHYFASKEELVEQIIEAYSSEMMALVPALPSDPFMFPRMLRDYMFELFGPESKHPKFLRFVVSVSRINPRFGRLNREIFLERHRQAMLPLFAPTALAVGIDPEVFGLALIAEINAIAFGLMEETILYDEQPLRPDFARFADLVVDMTERYLRSVADPSRALPSTP
ncbi:TetR/AcrR family transcriptional regulator [Nannocystaceae bacterium ST9]